METNQILQANLLDILFDGRNKDYGAYELRNNYDKRIKWALVITVLFILGAVVAKTISDRFSAQTYVPVMESGDITLVKVPKEELHVEIPKPKPAAKVQVATKIYTNPVISHDDVVIKPPVDMAELDKANIGAEDIKGDVFTGIIAPPAEIIGTQVIAPPADKKEDLDKPFIRVEIDAVFPGGPDAWQKYLSRKISSQLDEFTETDFGTCSIRFIVDINGKVSDVVALNMKNSRLAEIAVNAIRKGPDWIPAQQNGRFVKAYRTQPVTLNNPDR